MHMLMSSLCTYVFEFGWILASQSCFEYKFYSLLDSKARHLGLNPLVTYSCANSGICLNLFVNSSFKNQNRYNKTLARLSLEINETIHVIYLAQCVDI